MRLLDRPVHQAKSWKGRLSNPPTTASWVVGKFDCGGVPGWKTGGAGRIFIQMTRDNWVEYLICIRCRTIGAANLSTADKLSWDVQVDSVPEGFRTTQSEYGVNFRCVSCG